MNNCFDPIFSSYLTNFYPSKYPFCLNFSDNEGELEFLVQNRKK